MGWGVGCAFRMKRKKDNILFFKRFYLFLQRGEKRAKERVRNIDEREKH